VLARAMTWAAVPGASAVSVFVMDCTTIGAEEPTGTPPTIVVTVRRRFPNGTQRSSVIGANERYCVKRATFESRLTEIPGLATLARAWNLRNPGVPDNGFQRFQPHNMVL
jgi:hypothetical protein